MYSLPTLTAHLAGQIGYRGCAALCEALRGSTSLQKLHAAHKTQPAPLRRALEARFARYRPPLPVLLLDLRGLHLGAAERAQLLERTKYTSVQFKVDAPGGGAPAVCAEEQAGEMTQPGPLPTVHTRGGCRRGVGRGEGSRDDAESLPLPSSAEGAAPATEASGHAEAWLAELPRMNLF